MQNVLSKDRRRKGAGLRLGWTTLLLAALAAAPARADLERIHQLADRGRTEQALRQLEDLLVRNPEMAEGQLLRGVLLYQLDRSADAERAFRDLSLQLPERPEPANNLAVLQAVGGRRATAIKALERILAQHPGFDTAARNLDAVRSGPAPMRADLRYAPDSAILPEGTEGPRLRLILASRMGDAGRAAPAAAATSSEPPAPAPAEPPSPAAPGPPATPQPAAEEPAGEPQPPPPALPGEPATAEQPADDGGAPGAGEPAAREEPPPAAQGAPRTPAAAAAPAPAPPASQPAPEAPERPAPAAPDRRVELASVVEAWAAAWSEQRVKEYLAYYATDFEPAGFPSRRAWEAARRQRVAAPAFIEVEIDPETLEVREAGPGEASVTFTQRYRSDRFSDTVVKTLDLVREAGAWRIRRELAR